MMTLQHTFGILLLVCSVAAVSLPEKRRGRVKNHDEDFGYSNNLPENSEEAVPVKFGRTIYQSAWSTEDTESSDENNEESTKARDEGTKSWSLSNALRSALNFVKTLKIAGFDYPAIEDSNENANILNEGEDAYWPLFKKWLRRNKILKNDDSLSINLLGHNPRFNTYNRKNYKKKPRKKYFKNAKPSEDENQSFDENGNTQRNPKPHENNRNKLTQIPKISNHRISDDGDQGSKELSALHKEEQCHSFTDKSCESSKTLNYNKNRKSNSLIKTNSPNEEIEMKEAVFKHPNHTSAELTTKSSRKRTIPHDTLKNSHNNKPNGKTSPETQTVPSRLPISAKQQDLISFLQSQNKTNLKAISSTNFKIISGDSILNQAPIHIQNKQVFKPKKGQNIPQSQNALNSTVHQQLVINSFTERPAEIPVKNNRAEDLKTADTARETINLAQYPTNKSLAISSSSTKVYSKNYPSTQSVELHEKYRKKLKIPANVSHANTLFNSSPQPKNKTTQEKNLSHSQVIKSVPSTILTENASPTESQSKRNLNKNSGNFQKNKQANTDSAISPTTVKNWNKKNSHDIPAIKSVPQSTSSLSKEKNTMEEISMDLKDPRKTDTTTPTPANSSLSKSQDENVLQLNLDNLPVTDHTKMFSRPSPHPSQKKNIENESSNIPQITKNAYQQKIHASLFPHIIPDEKENLTKLNRGDSQGNKNIQLITKPLSASSSKSARLLKVKFKDSQINEKTLQPATNISNSSSQYATNKMLKKAPSNDLSKLRSISKATDSTSVAQHETINVSDSSSNPQSIKSREKNSNNSQKPTMHVNSYFPQTTDEVIPKVVSNGLPMAKTASIEKVQSTNSSFELPEKNIREETSNIPLVHDGIKTDSLIENISKEYGKNPKINERATNSVSTSPQANKKHILEKSSVPKAILTRLEETPLKKVVSLEDIKIESMNEKNDFEPSDESTEDSSIMSDESYYTDNNTFAPSTSTEQNNADFDESNSQSEELDSYSGMDSEDDELQSNESAESDREDVEKSEVLNTDESFPELKEKFQLTNEKSYVSSSAEELSDNKVENQTRKDGEPQEKFDTFLQYLYNHSNSSFFQSLRNESQTA